MCQTQRELAKPEDGKAPVNRELTLTRSYSHSMVLGGFELMS
jgi:hypothetical protein